MRITKIEPQKRQKNRSSVYLDDSFAFGIDDFDLFKLKLSVGQDISEECLTGIRETVLVSSAKNYGMKLCAARSYTKAGLKRKMTEKGFGEWEIELTLSFLEEYRLLDDEEYVRRFVNDAVCLKGYGKFRIQNDLREKGIPKDVMEKVLAEFDFGRLEEEMILPLAQKKLGDDYSIRNIMKTKRYLASRGFGFEAIDRALKQIARDSEEVWDEC